MILVAVDMLSHAKLIAAGLILVCALVAIWAYGHSRYNAGETAAEARMQKQVDAANARTADLELAARNVTLESGHAIETERSKRNTESDRALANLQPARLCKPADRSEVPGATDPAAATDGTK